MTPRERVKAVYEGRVPDQVPLMLDLSHWYRKNCNVPFDLTGFKGVEQGLVDLHKRAGAAAYIEVIGAFYELYFDDDSISDKAWTDEHGVFRHEITTPLGQLTEERVFEQTSYSYNIRRRLIQTVDDFKIVRYMMEHCRCRPRFDKYDALLDALGELTFPYCITSYSGLGYLMSRYFGVEKTCMAIFDHPEEVRALVDAVNACVLRVVDVVADGPFDVVLHSDNFDGNVQSPKLFNQYTRGIYTEMARRLHAKGKYLAVHVDGEMRGCLRNMAECGVDCIDAATPAPMFALTPAEAREQAGPDMILSGGIPANVFGATGTDDEFIECVKSWLDTRHTSPRLILAAGDQVPPDAPWHRIQMLPELVEKYGRYY